VLPNHHLKYVITGLVIVREFMIGDVLEEIRLNYVIGKIMMVVWLMEAVLVVGQLLDFVLRARFV
jgi:hypothetical protein